MISNKRKHRQSPINDFIEWENRSTTLSHVDTWDISRYSKTMHLINNYVFERKGKGNKHPECKGYNIEIICSLDSHMTTIYWGRKRTKNCTTWFQIQQALCSVGTLNQETTEFISKIQIVPQINKNHQPSNKLGSEIEKVLTIHQFTTLADKSWLLTEQEYKYQRN